MPVATNNQTVLHAVDYIDPSQGLVASAKLLAKAVNQALATHTNVVVELADLRSVSSSYFNMLLLAVADTSGNDAIKSRLSLKFSSDAQRQIFRRSFDAVLRSRVQ
jgi:hypothetical protein